MYSIRWKAYFERLILSTLPPSLSPHNPPISFIHSLSLSYFSSSSTYKSLFHYCFSLLVLLISKLHSLALPYLTLPYLTLPYLTLPYLTLPYLTLPYLTLPCLALPCLTLPYLIIAPLMSIYCRAHHLYCRIRVFTMKDFASYPHLIEIIC